MPDKNDPQSKPSSPQPSQDGQSPDGQEPTLSFEDQLKQIIANPPSLKAKLLAQAALETPDE